MRFQADIVASEQELHHDAHVPQGIARILAGQTVVVERHGPAFKIVHNDPDLHGWAVGPKALKLRQPKSQEDQLAEAKHLLKVAVSHSSHDEDCARQIFWSNNKHLPCNHPAWKSMPECSCWLRKVSDFLAS